MVGGGDEDAVPITDMEVEEAAMPAPSNQTQTKAVSKSKRVKTPLNHPPYRQMIAEALSELKEGKGSSQKAIAKFIQQKYKTHLQPNLKVLQTQLKNLTKAGELRRSKNSFKLKRTKKVENKKQAAKSTTKISPSKKTATPPSNKN